MTGLAISFHNIPGAMMRVLNCFTRRGLLIEAVWCAPEGDHHRATVLVEAQPITVDQIVRELESTVGVDGVERLEKTRVKLLAPWNPTGEAAGNGGSQTPSKEPSPDGSAPSLFPEERKFVEENLEALRAAHADRYIAVLGASVVDSDSDFSALAERVFRQVGYRPIFMPFIGKSERVYRIASPRIAH
jgi:acetolactate synthase small subunit